jgi:hypothetical protein
LSNRIEISVSTFTTLPGARYKKDGDGSAEEFFDDYIKQHLENKEPILIDFDNTWGYASSFLSELALKISRQCKHNKLDVREKIEIKSNDEPGLVKRFWDYIDESIDINN